MAKTKRVQVLMEPAEFDRLAHIARKRGTSVAGLLREASTVHWLSAEGKAARAKAAGQFLGLKPVALPGWKALKAELETRRG
jgi:hypothetical protein